MARGNKGNALTLVLLLVLLSPLTWSLERREYENNKQFPKDKEGEGGNNKYGYVKPPASLAGGKLSINASGLSITSFLWNPTPAKSEWVDRIFGGKAVYHNRTSGHTPLQRAELSLFEVEARTRIFEKGFRMPEHGIWPTCSFELLGFGLLEADFPIKGESKAGNTPAVGNAFLKIEGATEEGDV